MKNKILSLVLIIFSGIFFAGFGNTAFAVEGDEDLYKELTNNLCASMKKKVANFERQKHENDFNYHKLSYEKAAYKAELQAYIALEGALICLDTGNDCRKDFEKVDNNYKIKTSDRDCVDSDNIEIPDTLEKLKYSSKQFTKSAKLFDQSLELYFGERHLPLGTPDHEGELDKIMTNNIITGAGEGFIHSTQNTLKNIFSGSLVKKVNRALGTVAILYLFILGAKFIFARGESERLSALKGQFAWIILGLGIISLAEFIGYEVFDPSGKNDILQGGASEMNFSYKVREIVRYFEYFAGGLMLINALISAYELIMAGEEDESISKEKQFLKSFLMGTAFILLAEVIVRVLSFERGIEHSANVAVKEIAGLVNFSLSFIGIIAVAMLVLAGLYYVISFGDEDQMSRAKRIIISSLAGAIIAFSAYSIIRFLIV